MMVEAAANENGGAFQIRVVEFQAFEALMQPVVRESRHGS